MTEHVASGPSPRALSRRLVLDQLRDRGARTINDISLASGLSRATVSSVIAELQRDGSIVREEPSRLGAGRPARVYALTAASGYVGAVDMGHSHVSTAVASVRGEVLTETRVELDVDASGIQAIFTAIDSLRLAMADADVSQLSAATLGVPGPLDRTGDARVIAGQVMPGWRGIAPLDEFKRGVSFIKGPVLVENEVHLGAVGEHALGAARGFGNLLYVKVSAGIGSGTVLSGQLFRGAHGNAGEIGHVQVREGGALCRCGGRGCLETVASTSFAVDSLSEVHRRRLSLRDVQDLLAQGDSITNRLIADIGRDVGRVVAHVASHLDPDVIVIGGPLADARATLAGGVRQSLEAGVQPFMASQVRVKQGDLGVRAPLLGGVVLAQGACLPT